MIILPKTNTALFTFVILGGFVIPAVSIFFFNLNLKDPPTYRLFIVCDAAVMGVALLLTPLYGQWTKDTVYLNERQRSKETALRMRQVPERRKIRTAGMLSIVIGLGLSWVAFATIGTPMADLAIILVVLTIGGYMAYYGRVAQKYPATRRHGNELTQMQYRGMQNAIMSYSKGRLIRLWGLVLLAIFVWFLTHRT